MDNAETESNHSCNSDSLVSNASSLSGLSLYGHEFAELRHLINPAKYPQPYLERNSTPTPDNHDPSLITQFKNELQKSLQLNEHYKIDLQNLERVTELKYYDKIDQLLQANGRLEGELQSAKTQIDRLIKSCKQNNDVIAYTEKLDLENQIYRISNELSKLHANSAKLQEEKGQLDLDAKSLRIKLSDLETERQIKDITVGNLKQKVSELHIEIQNLHKQVSSSDGQLSLLNTKLIESEKAKLWYKDQLSQCQCDKVKLNEELTKCRSQLNKLIDTTSDLKIELSRQVHEVDAVRLQALKEKEELLQKLETLNLDCKISKMPLDKLEVQFNGCHSEDEIEDMREEINKLKGVMKDKNSEIERLNQDNSIAIAKCIALQNTLKQRESDIECLEVRHKQVLNKLKYVENNEKEKLADNMQLKGRIGELEVELRTRNLEKYHVDQSVQLIREQFVKLKENYERIKLELLSKNKDILKLEKDKQDLFMNNNWTICELENSKHNNIIINELKRENENLVGEAELLSQKLKNINVKHSKLLKTLEDKEQTLEDNLLKISNFTTALTESELRISQKEKELNLLDHHLKEYRDKTSEFDDAFEKMNSELDSKELALKVAVKTIEQLQVEHQEHFNSLSLEKNNLQKSYEALQAKYNNDFKSKDQSISDLKNKLFVLENDWQKYLKRITDDQKVKFLSCIQVNGYMQSRELPNGLIFKEMEQYVANFFNNLNVEDFESTVNIRLKYLDERILFIKKKSEIIEETRRNGNEKEKIKELEVMLHVKDREIQERQKKMDRNNRTLLRKVKEHMRGRNAAEKELKYLQDMYNSLADSHNTVTLNQVSKDLEIQTLENLCKNYKKEIEKLRGIVASMELKAANHDNCELCGEFRVVQGKLLHFETLCEELRNRNKILEKEAIDHMINIENLERDNLDHINRLSELKTENSGVKLTLNNFNSALQEKIRSLEELVKNLENQLFEKDQFYKASQVDIDKLQVDLNEARDKIQFLFSENEINSSNLQRTVEYSQELERKIAKLEKQAVDVSHEYEKNLCDREKIVLSLRSNINALQNDKYFFQRLSNDLKIALNSYLDYNKKLQEQLSQISTLPKYSNESISIFEDNLSLGKYNDEYIQKLLAENRATASRKPVAEEIRGCLNKLRDEIYCLQRQISQKTVT
ncbi:putative leucine-rich repeat-containing protein DDB_G0290503 [Euwallacea fornicatus]|uniref:putative leucine-rich repeat-containing protein DDB_G0290503 n=1 Tax=Euwallacea fornicatus TaxID=995702 RepID=UPI00338E3E37